MFDLTVAFGFAALFFTALLPALFFAPFFTPFVLVALFTPFVLVALFFVPCPSAAAVDWRCAFHAAVRERM
ncbi:MAG: hypothetical protein LC785_16330 [Acidobacteria bacterium]|nr:hypothetical protein [Acidobacteriota bacterium]MCA1643471.1 hypothetical protein [Acidobacteriota bacterium]